MISFPDVVHWYILELNFCVHLHWGQSREKIIVSTLIIIISSWEVSYFKDPEHPCIALSGLLLVVGNYSWHLPQFFFTNLWIFIWIKQLSSLTVILESVNRHKKYPLIALYVLQCYSWQQSQVSLKV